MDARPHSAPGDWPGLLSAQLCGPVRWRQSLETLAREGATRMAEVGPGGVLTGLARRTLPDVTAVSVASPDDLEKLLETLSGNESWLSYTAAHQGEHLYTSERVVVSPAAGIFDPEPGLSVPGPGGLAGRPGPEVKVEVGASLGRVGEVEVRTPFGGRLVGFLAHPGERVMPGQPVAWLRVLSDET